VLIVKIWNIPETLSQEALEGIFRKIVDYCVGDPELLVKSEKNILILFPSDRMRYGQGTEILYEIYHDRFIDKENDGTINALGLAITRAVQAHVPEARYIFGIYPRADGDYLMDFITI
jgi:hypothetical protein